MTNVYLNSKKLNKELQPSQKLSEVYDMIMSEYAHPDDVFSKILLDGKTFSDQEEAQFLNQNLDQFANVEFDIKNKFDLAFEALDCGSEFIDSIISKIHKTAAYYQAGSLESGDLFFSQTIESLDLFIQLLSNVHHTLRGKYDQALQLNKTFHQLEIHLLSIIKAIVPAKEKNDMVMLSDLLEYELIDNLTQWKITAIPEMKSIQNNG